MIRLWPLLLLLACAEDRAPLTEGEDAARPFLTGCQQHSDCTPGWCAGELGCDVPWTCTDEIPCSAAAPQLVCTCAGEARTLAAGCPGTPFALYLPGATLEIQEGEPCDPAGIRPLRHDISLNGEGFAAFEGQLIQASVYDPRNDRFVGQMRTAITGGVFELRWPGGLYPGQASRVEVFLVDEAGMCRPEGAWRLPVAEPGALRLRAEAPINPAVCGG